jgi:hypothetical protein
MDHFKNAELLVDTANDKKLVHIPRVYFGDEIDFYHAYYKRQVRDEDTGEWRDTYYTFQGIVVMADSYDSAKRKIEECLKKVETGDYRAVLTSDITKCLGLDRRHGFDFSFDVSPIV